MYNLYPLEFLRLIVPDFFVVEQPLYDLDYFMLGVTGLVNQVV